MKDDNRDDDLDGLIEAHTRDRTAIRLVSLYAADNKATQYTDNADPMRRFVALAVYGAAMIGVGLMIGFAKWGGNPT